MRLAQLGKHITSTQIWRHFDGSVPISEFVADGDSLTATNHVPYTASIALPPKWRIDNVAVEGRQIPAMTTAATTTVDPLFTTAPDTKNIVAILGGTNDCMGGIPVATIWTRLQTYASARRSAGFKVIGMTLPSLRNFEGCRNGANALIRAGWVGVFDALVDLGADATIGIDGACDNTTYFLVDGVHPTRLAVESIYTPLIKAAFNTIS